VVSAAALKETPSMGRSREGRKYKGGRKIFYLFFECGSESEPLFLSAVPCGSKTEPLFATPVVDGIIFNAISRDCPCCVASKLMPLAYPFTELGMGEVVFMGTAKIFLKNLPIWV
jgi:hypothetical protein